MAQPPRKQHAVFERVVRTLLIETSASRTTLRLDAPDSSFPVVAEACAPGIRSMRDVVVPDLSSSGTYEYLMRRKRILIQGDCLKTRLAPPQSAIEEFGLRAQMLAPIVVEDRVVGIISVHQVGETRSWKTNDKAALATATECVRRQLATRSAGGGSL